MNVYNRSLPANTVYHFAHNKDWLVAKFTFKELCSNYLGPADFIHIAETFRVIFISHVPLFTLSERSEVMFVYIVY